MQLDLAISFTDSCISCSLTGNPVRVMGNDQMWDICSICVQHVLLSVPNPQFEQIKYVFCPIPLPPPTIKTLTVSCMFTNENKFI